MGTAGDCDDSMMESFRGTIQIELLGRKAWKTRKELVNAIFEWIECWHNPQAKAFQPRDARPRRLRDTTQAARPRRLAPAPEVSGELGQGQKPSSATATSRNTGASTSPKSTSGSTQAQPKASTHSAPDPLTQNELYPSAMLPASRPASQENPQVGGLYTVLEPHRMVAVPPRRAGLGASVLSQSCQNLLEVVADAGRLLRAAQIAAAAGLSTDQARVEGLRSQCAGRGRPGQPLPCLRELLRSCWRWPSLLPSATWTRRTPRCPLTRWYPGETTTCLFRSAGSLGGSSPKLTRKFLYRRP
jgi:hypothetical protein